MTSALCGFWDGIVVDVKAPATEPIGSVKVRIYDLHGDVAEVPNEDLPWAWPNLMFAGANSGLIGVPPVNSIVNIIFKHGDKRYPMWIGGSHKITPPDAPAEWTAAKQGLEPKGWMWITPGGYGIIINELTKVVEIKTPSPSTSGIKIDLTSKKVEITSDSSGSSSFQLVLDETLQKVTLTTPAGQKVELDGAAGEAKITGTAKAILTAALVELGLGASQAVVLGTAFAQLWLNHGHQYTWTPGGGAGLTGGPISPALTPGTAILIPGTHLSATVSVRA